MAAVAFESAAPKAIGRGDLAEVRGSFTLAALRTGAVLTGGLIGAVPWALCVGVEELARRVLGSNEYYAVRGLGWRYLSTAMDDVMTLSAQSVAFGAMLWTFPEARACDADSTGLVALTIDDAPGDNPAALGALLDELRELGVHATFFCTTNTITPEMRPLMRRIVDEGHEVANHCPRGRPACTLFVTDDDS